MKERFAALSPFRRKLLVYAGVLGLLMLGIWFAAWNYAAAYERAQPSGAMAAYMEREFPEQLTGVLERYCEDKANAYQTREEVAAAVEPKVLDQTWSFAKSKGYTSRQPVYTLYCGGTPMGEVRLEQGTGGILDFGLTPWEVPAAEPDFSSLEKTVTVVAPADCAFTLNGEPVRQTGEPAEWYPEFAQYAETIKVPMELMVYSIEGLCVEELSVAPKGDYRVVQGEAPDTYYLIPPPDEKTAAALEQLSTDFVEAYLKYTSNSGTSYYELSRYVAPGSELLSRLYKSLDGMSWVHYTTGKLLDFQVSNLEYFGNTATYDAAYTLNLKTGEMAGNMHVIVVRGAYGWRVTDIELF